MPAKDKRLYFHLQRTAHLVQKQADQRLIAAANVTVAQAAILMVLDEHGGCSQKTLANHLGQNDSAITAMVTRLVRLGHIHKVRDDRDGRAVRLRLTSSGKAALAAARGPFDHINATIDACLSADETSDLADCLRRLARAFGGPDA